MRQKNRSTQNADAEVGVILRQFDEVGLTDALPDVRAAREQATQFGTRARTAPATFDQLRQELARELVDQSIDIDTAVDRIADADRATARTGAGNELLLEAAKVAHNRSGALLAAYGDRLITDILRPVAADITKAAAKAAAAVPDWCTSDTEAIKGDRRVRDAWATLTQLGERWDKLTGLAHQLRLRGYLPVPRTVDVAQRTPFEHLHPDRVSRFDPAHRPPSHLILAADIAAGSEPTLRTGAEVADDLAAEQARHDAERNRLRAEHRRYESAPTFEARSRVRQAAAEALAADRAGPSEPTDDAA